MQLWGGARSCSCCCWRAWERAKRTDALLFSSVAALGSHGIGYSSREGRERERESIRQDIHLSLLPQLLLLMAFFLLLALSSHSFGLTEVELVILIVIVIEVLVVWESIVMFRKQREYFDKRGRIKNGFSRSFYTLNSLLPWHALLLLLLFETNEPTKKSAKEKKRGKQSYVFPPPTKRPFFFSQINDYLFDYPKQILCCTLVVVINIK